MQLKGGIPTTQARDLVDPAARERSRRRRRSGAARSSSTTTRRCASVTPQALTETGRLFPLRDAYLFDELTQAEAAWGNDGYAEPAIRRAVHLQRRPGATRQTPSSC